MSEKKKDKRVVHQECRSRNFASLQFWTTAHLEYDRVNVLAEQVEEKPVPHVALPDDRVYAFFFHTPAMSQLIFLLQKSDSVSPVSQTKHKCPNIGAEDDDNAVDDDQAGEEPQEEKPEPDEDVDLFVDCNRIRLLSKLLTLDHGSFIDGGNYRNYRSKIEFTQKTMQPNKN